MGLESKDIILGFGKDSEGEKGLESISGAYCRRTNRKMGGAIGHGPPPGHCNGGGEE